ncbi:MAG: type II toxin-antitoxin system RelE/ParE family toxin [Rhodospirillaceae bacterium]|nr:type II toxin-antitoxin system RelE/ParE family toxin [Rhodospirillaceae bacterium]
MKFTVVITPTAEADLDKILRHIARDNPAAARKFVAGLRAKMKTLMTMPRRCPLAPENGLDDIEIRHLLSGHYRIIFTVDPGRVTILQVRHGARLPERQRLE